MFGSAVLEVAIGMALLFLYTSLLVTALGEMIEARLQTRAGDLERGVRELLADPNGKGLATRFYNHPLIYSLFRGRYDPAELKQKKGGEWVMSRRGRSALPAYIPAGHFAAALLDLAARGTGSGDGPITVATLRETVRQIDNDSVSKAILAATDGAGDDLAKVKANLAAWFDGTMDRVSGWYKKRTQAVVFGLGLAAAVAFNIDALNAFGRLSSDGVLRQTVAASATSAARDTVPALSLDDARRELTRLGLPIGWGSVSVSPRCGAAYEPLKPCDASGWWTAATMAVGWLMTALAVTLGAPFWFDVLNKFMVIRSTVKPREKSPEEGSEDRA
jgi:hypothetical protein